jgi:hypothetical protein
MTTDKRVSFLQYLNTVILTAILGMATIISINVSKVRTDQETQAKELVSIKTIQDANTLSIQILNSRVSALEIYNQTMIKQWVDDNYVRLPQKAVK